MSVCVCVCSCVRACERHTMTRTGTLIVDRYGNERRPLIRTIFFFARLESFVGFTFKFFSHTSQVWIDSLVCALPLWNLCSFFIPANVPMHFFFFFRSFGSFDIDWFDRISSEICSCVWPKPWSHVLCTARQWEVRFFSLLPNDQCPIVHCS